MGDNADNTMSDATEDSSAVVIVDEFQSLQQKSEELFEELKHLPQFGQRIWQPYFGKAFSTFTKLWKSQQEHRPILEESGVLQKWDIGNIASRIGQLYYHFYLKTSKVNYLDEAFQFYSVIKSRGYYKDADSKELAVKKMRYYTRFIVVCLLLDKKAKLQELIQDLSVLVNNYHETYEIEDKKEWNAVTTELKAFSSSNCIVRIIGDDGKPVNPTYRCTQILDAERTVMSSNLQLKEAVVIGNCTGQVKFSDLTVDTFRFLQLLEYDPSLCKRSKQDLTNPHKYILYKPTFNQICTYLSAGIQELPIDGVMLCYVSSIGYMPTYKPSQIEEFGLHFSGGVRTGPAERTKAMPDPQCLYPLDLLPFTRRPLMVIIDSDNSVVFKNMYNVFGQPLLVLMSPSSYPQPFQGLSKEGNLLTLFLYSPLEALCVICSVSVVSHQNWVKCEQILDRTLEKILQLCGNCHSLDMRVCQLMGDSLLAPLIAKFLFCSSTLYLHQVFKEPAHLPTSFPEFPSKEIIHHPSILASILSISSLLEVRSLFYELNDL
ncbi:protein SCAI-like [Dysidea avara]|uniref:protein SCAI-like n=1 Tax=Dysidea avara TaxID=196820 RepID=UPI00331AF3B1